MIVTRECVSLPVPRTSGVKGQPGLNETIVVVKRKQKIQRGAISIYFRKLSRRCYSQDLALAVVGRLSNSRSGCGGLNRGGCRRSAVAIHLSLGAVAGDVASLAAAVAGLACSVKWASIGSSAVTRDVALGQVSRLRA